MDLFHKWLLNNDGKTLKNLTKFSITRTEFENEIKFKHNKLRNQFTNPGGDNGKDNFSQRYTKLLTLKEKEKKYVIDPNLYESIEQGFLRFKERIYADLEQTDDLTDNEKEKAVLVTKQKFQLDFCIPESTKNTKNNDKTVIMNLKQKLKTKNCGIAWTEPRKNQLNNLASRKSKDFRHQYICKRINDEICEVVEFEENVDSLISEPTNYVFKSEALESDELFYFKKKN